MALCCAPLCSVVLEAREEVNENVNFTKRTQLNKCRTILAVESYDNYLSFFGMKNEPKSGQNEPKLKAGESSLGYKMARLS